MTNEMVLKYSKYIYGIMKRFPGYSKEDLYQAGVIGLINAYNNYDSSYNAKFTTYAYHYIMGEMYKLVNEDKNIKLGVNIIKLKKQIEKATNLLVQKNNCYPTTKELADFLELNELDIIECLKITNPVISTDNLITDDISIIDTVESPNMDIDKLISIKDELNKLNKQERFIIESNLNDYTQEEIANKLGINQVKVSRELKKIKTKIKTNIA